MIGKFLKISLGHDYNCKCNDFLNGLELKIHSYSLQHSFVYEVKNYSNQQPFFVIVY